MPSKDEALFLVKIIPLSRIFTVVNKTLSLS